MSLRRALLFLLTAFSLAAQVNTGQILGLVVGAGNAKLAGARVTAVRRSTGVTIETITNTAGFYLLPNLQPGEWDISIGGPALPKCAP